MLPQNVMSRVGYEALAMIPWGKTPENDLVLCVGCLLGANGALNKCRLDNSDETQFSTSSPYTGDRHLIHKHITRKVVEALLRITSKEIDTGVCVEILSQQSSIFMKRVG